MKNKIVTIGVLASICLGSTACTQTEQRTAGYGVSGAALGALAGGAIGGNGRAALAGATIGALGGSIVGNAVSHGYGQGQQPQAVETRRTYYVQKQRPAAAVVVRPQQHLRRYCEYKDAYGETYKAPC